MHGIQLGKHDKQFVVEKFETYVNWFDYKYKFFRNRVLSIFFSLKPKSRV